MKKTSLRVLGCLVLALSASPAGASELSGSDHFVIEFNGKVPGNLAARVAQAGGTLLRVHPQIGYASVISTDPDFASRIQGVRGVAAVHPDLKVQMVPDVRAELERVGAFSRSSAAATDPTAATLFPCQWQLRQIHAPEAWAMGALGSPEAKVAVLDGGADPTHVDLAGRIDEDNSTSLLSIENPDCPADDKDTFLDYGGHGTFITSQVTSNGVNIAAVAPETQVVAIKVIDCTGQGQFSDIIAAILHAADLPDVTAINLSLGGFVKRNDPGAKPLLHAVRDAVDYAYDHGKLVTTVAGNQHVDLRDVRPLVPVPTDSGEAIGVYSLDVRGNLASYSNWGFPSAWIGAPGGDNVPPKRPFAGCPLPVEQQGRILGACSSFLCGGATDEYFTSRGTSASAPIVAGVAALVDGEHDGALSGRKVKFILRKRADDLGDPGIDPIFGVGLVNAGRAVR
jgi:subtilisin family serine protease